MRDRANKEYQVIQHPRVFLLPDGQKRVVIRVQLISATRQLRKMFHVSGRQWTKMRKAASRAARAAARAAGAPASTGLVRP